MKLLAAIAVLLFVSVAGGSLNYAASLSLTSAVESQFSAFWADKFSRFNKSLLEVLNSDE